MSKTSYWAQRKLDKRRDREEMRTARVFEALYDGCKHTLDTVHAKIRDIENYGNRETTRRILKQLPQEGGVVVSFREGSSVCYTLSPDERAKHPHLVALVEEHERMKTLALAAKAVPKKRHVIKDPGYALTVIALVAGRDGLMVKIGTLDPIDAEAAFRLKKQLLTLGYGCGGDVDNAGTMVSRNVTIYGSWFTAGQLNAIAHELSLVIEYE